MPSLVEDYAAKIKWRVCPCNVVVEGTSDASVMQTAARLYEVRHRVQIIGADLGILPAGRGEDGGVDGLNRRLNAVRQMADVDRAADGSLRHRFIGLYDNDRAGRYAVRYACDFDRRLRVCRDLFLLNPEMPLACGADHVTLLERFKSANSAYTDLDWELEDLLSDKLVFEFERTHPGAVQSTKVNGTRKHREFTRDGKRDLVAYVRANATLEDVEEVVKLIRALRDYHGLQIDHIIC